MSRLYFTKDHEWLRVEGDVAVVGISDHAQHALGDIVYVELPEAGAKFAQGDQAAVVESAKAASEVYAPAGGEVVGLNDALVNDPALINNAALTDGWFFKLKLSDAGQLGSLMDEAAYDAYVKSL